MSKLDYSKDKNNKMVGNSDIAEFFDEMSQERNKKIQANPIVEYEQNVRTATVLDFLSPGQGEKILDIGCGNARDISYMVEQGAQVIGVDISEGMVAEAKMDLEKHGYENITLESGDATQMSYADGEFDKVLCSEVIEHIPDAEKALDEMWRVLKPGGILILSTPNPNSWYGFDRYVVWERVLRKKWHHPYDHWRSMKELLSLTEQKGFKTLRRAGACYVPGFLLTYFLLPGFLQRLLIKLVGMIEPIFAQKIPQYGYMVCATVVKTSPE